MTNTYYWDQKDCPRDGCDGELQQQDWYNVMCLSCDEVYTPYEDDESHVLVSSNDETVARNLKSVYSLTCRDCDWSRTVGAEQVAHDECVAHELDNGHTTDQENVPVTGGATIDG